MKTRNSLVSNNSSSSFVCSICGEIESGMDLGLSDLEMFECSNCGSDMHISCAKSFLTEDEKSDLSDDISDGDSYTKSPLCPICSLKALDKNDELDYYRMYLNTNNNNTLNMIKENLDHMISL